MAFSKVMSRLRLVVLAFGLLGLLAGSCTADGQPDARRILSSPVPGSPEPEPQAPPTPTPRPDPVTVRATPAAPTPASEGGLARASIRLERIATLSQPLGMAVRPNDEALYVAEKGGRIRAIRGGSVDPAVVLDISGEVSGGSEQGLLGLAFRPDGSRLYVNFTNREGHTVVREYVFSGGRAIPGEARQILFLEQPRSNHNGGQLVFGPDGHLWIGTGDGGGAGDPSDHGQRLDTLLGKMLRIDPRPQGGDAYRVPSDNPFVGRSGVRPEIWAFGLRNPWRYSFDTLTGDLYIGDVGQNRWEWVNFQPADSSGGENYGWARMEGSNRYSGEPPPDHVPPIYEYANDAANCAIIGGYVYRGQRIPDLRGAYVFGDLCAGRPRAFVQDGGRAVGHRFLDGQVSRLSGFGRDHAGELYMLSLQGPVYRVDPA